MAADANNVQKKPSFAEQEANVKDNFAEQEALLEASQFCFANVKDIATTRAAYQCVDLFKDNEDQKALWKLLTIGRNHVHRTFSGSFSRSLPIIIYPHY